MKNKITIVVVGSNKKSAIDQWLRWYKDLKYDYQVVLCDITKYTIDDDSVIFLTGYNRTQLINRAFRDIKTKYVLLTHVNVKPCENMFNHLVGALITNRNLAAVSPRINFMNQAVYSGTYFHKDLMSHAKIHPQEDGVYVTDSIAKEMVLIRRNDWHLIGNLDPNYNGVDDELDWSTRAIEIGFKLAVNFNISVDTLGVRKHNEYLQMISDNLYNKKHNFYPRKILAIIKRLFMNLVSLPLDIITLKPHYFIMRYYAFCVAYFNINKLEEID